MNKVTDQATELLHNVGGYLLEIASSGESRPWDLIGTITPAATTTGSAQAAMASRQSPPSALASGAVAPVAIAAPALSVAV